jgi:hypothetical protein
MNTFKHAISKLALLSCAVLFSAMVWAAPPEGKGNRPGGGEETQGNNLSFPAIPVDGYPLSLIAPENFSFEVPYAGEYPGLTDEEIDGLGDIDWYPQKTEGNIWQAEFLPDSSETIDVSYVDWGDNIEAVNPKVRRPFRLEIQLYKRLAELEDEMTMTGYEMAVLEYPSSSTELQGTNKEPYESEFATVVSNLWNLRIQYCGDAIPDGLYWDPDAALWVSDIPNVSCYHVPVSFAVELNVGGKLIFGGSQGGWKPTQAGYYRITFYGPENSYLSLKAALVRDFADGFADPVAATESDEGDDGDEGAAEPVVDPSSNISFVDVLAVGGGGGGGGGKKK